MIEVKRKDLTIKVEPILSQKRNYDGVDYEKKCDMISVTMIFSNGKKIFCSDATLDKNGNIDMHETLGGRPIKINLSAPDMKEVKKLFDEREERKAKSYEEMKKADKEYATHRKMMTHMMNQ